MDPTMHAAPEEAAIPSRSRHMSMSSDETLGKRTLEVFGTRWALSPLMRQPVQTQGRALSNSSRSCWMRCVLELSFLREYSAA